jgi:nucleoside-diphosphate-sugar epimerase
VGVKWITPSLGTAAYYDVQNRPEVGADVLIDVRTLVDKEGNADSELREAVQKALTALRSDKRVVICCDMGFSRSNVLALAVLMSTGRSYSDSLELVSSKADVSEINLALLRQVRSLYERPDAVAAHAARRLMITGASGFVGASLIGQLAQEHQIFAPSRQELDLADAFALNDYIASNKIDVLMHLAHPRTRNSIAAVGGTVAMMKSALEVCRLNGTLLFWLSSLAIYSGYQTSAITHAHSELQPIPYGTYAESKFLCEELVRLYEKNHGTKTIVLRPAAVYGPGMPRSTIVAKFFEMAIQGTTIQTHEYENGLPAFDFLHIRDLAAAVRQALLRLPSRPVNVGTGRVTSTYDLARLISQIAGHRSSVERIGLAGKTYKIAVDPEEAAASLDWRPTIELTDGLLEMYDQYRLDVPAATASDANARSRLGGQTTND